MTNKKRKFRVLGKEKGILLVVLDLTARWRSTFCLSTCQSYNVGHMETLDDALQVLRLR
jgi:hypothetical protein